MSALGLTGYAQAGPNLLHAGIALRQPPPSLPTLQETLVATYTDTAGNVSVSCTTTGCLSTAVPVFTESLVCPGKKNSTCTYDVQVSGQVEVGATSTIQGENGLLQFLFDGKIPSSGGTDFNGFYSFQSFGPDFQHNARYRVFAQVTNTALNQKHAINVNLACEEEIGALGCFADAGPFSTLVVRVWTP
jgi:hypothetical protein